MLRSVFDGAIYREGVGGKGGERGAIVVQPYKCRGNAWRLDKRGL